MHLKPPCHNDLRQFQCGISVYMINGNQKEIIYNAYHESEAKIDWVDNTTVSINGKTLDMSSGETYDWRKE